MKGRVDHKEAGKTCVVVQGVERFEPSPEEVEAARSAAAQAALPPDPFFLSVDAARLPASIVDDLKDLLERFPDRPSSCSGCAPPRASGSCASAPATGSTPTPRCGRAYRSFSAKLPCSLPEGHRSAALARDAG